MAQGVLGDKGKSFIQQFASIIGGESKLHIGEKLE
jgi:hypothetical protein